VVNRWPAGVHGAGGSAGGASAAFGCGAAVTLASTANPTSAPLAQAVAIMIHPRQAQLRVILAWQSNLEAQPTGSDASGTGRTAPTW